MREFLTVCPSANCGQGEGKVKKYTDPFAEVMFGLDVPPLRGGVAGTSGVEWTRRRIIFVDTV